MKRFFPLSLLFVLLLSSAAHILPGNGNVHAQTVTFQLDSTQLEATVVRDDLYYPWDLWWVRELDSEGKNDASKRYNRLRKRVMTEVHNAFDAGESFDIVVDDGRPTTGYRHVVRIAGE